MKKHLLILTLLIASTGLFAQTAHLEQAVARASSSSALPYIVGEMNNETYVFATDIPFKTGVPGMLIPRHANLKKFDADLKQVFSKDILMPAADYFLHVTLNDKIYLIGVKSINKSCIASIYSLSKDGEIKLEKELGTINDNPFAKQARFAVSVSADNSKCMLIGSGYWANANAAGPIPEGNGSFFVAVYDANLNLIGSAIQETKDNWADFKVLDYSVLNNTNAYIAVTNNVISSDTKTKSNLHLYYFNAKANNMKEQAIALQDGQFAQSGKLFVQENGSVQICGFTTKNPKSWSDVTATISGVYSVFIEIPNAEPKINTATSFSDSLRNAVNGKNKVKDKKEIPASNNISAFLVGKDVFLVTREENSTTDTSSFQIKKEGIRVYSVSGAGKINWINTLSSWASADMNVNYMHASPIIAKQPGSLLFVYSDGVKTEKNWKDIYKSSILCKEVFTDGTTKQKTLFDNAKSDAALITLSDATMGLKDGLKVLLVGQNVFRPAYIRFH